MLEAADGKEAKDVFSVNPGKIDLVFTDVVLTDMSGLALIDELRAQNADLGVLVCSGYTDERSQWDAVSGRGFAYLQKPYSIDDLLTAMSKAVRTRGADQ